MQADKQACTSVRLLAKQCICLHEAANCDQRQKQGFATTRRMSLRCVVISSCLVHRRHQFKAHMTHRTRSSLVQSAERVRKQSRIAAYFGHEFNMQKGKASEARKAQL